MFKSIKNCLIIYFPITHLWCMSVTAKGITETNCSNFLFYQFNYKSSCKDFNSFVLFIPGSEQCFHVFTKSYH